MKGHLDGWAGDMETAQKKADRALEDAKEAQRTLDSHKPESKESKGKGSGKGDSDPGDDPAVKQAKEDLETARRKLDSAVFFYDERADHYAGKIRSSIDDDMEDSWWNDVKAWVGDADWLKGLAEALSWIATGLSILAIFFPALGPLALILTGAVALIHLVQALTGNGSWFDVLMDVGALKMASNGIKAAKAIKGLQKGAREVAQGLAKQKAQRRGDTRERQRTPGRWQGRPPPPGRGLPESPKRCPPGEGSRPARADLAGSGRGVRGQGDRQAGEGHSPVARRLPGNAALSKSADDAATHLSTYQGSWIVGSSLNAGDKVAGKVDATADEYDRAKARVQAPVGSQW